MPPPSSRLRSLAALAAAAAVWAASPARAADTWERYDHGWASVELTLGGDGLGLPLADGLAWSSLLLAYGLTDWLAVCATVDGEIDAAFRAPWGQLGVGLLTTPFDTAHVDLDVLLWVFGGGPDLADAWIEPQLELNLDLEPDQALAGVYLRLAAPLFARPTGGGRSIPALELSLTSGLYATVAPGHQLFGELELLVAAVDEEVTFEVGRLGYNLEVADNVELVVEGNIAFGDDETPVSFGAAVGFIWSVETALAPSEPDEAEDEGHFE